MKTVTIRLKPGEELKASMDKVVKNHGVRAGFVITAVGCLSEVTCRMAGATPKVEDIRTFKEELEIVSLVGTFSVDGHHLHISLSDKDGIVKGGHLKGGRVKTTLELVIGYEEGASFRRSMDEATGFKELCVS